MPINQDTQKDAAKHSTANDAQGKPTTAPDSLGKKPMEPNVEMPGREDSQADDKTPQDKRNPEANRSWNSGRDQRPDNAAKSDQPSGNTAREKDTRPVADAKPDAATATARE